MFKVMWLLKGKPGVSRDAFRDWYETRHSVMAEKCFGRLLLEYRRNYTVEAHPLQAGRSWDYDCIAEWVMPDEAAFNEIMRICADPVAGKGISDDTAEFLSPDSVLIKCDTRGRSAAPGGARGTSDAR